MQKVLDFIKRRWPETTRIHRTTEGTLLGLPHPYTVPGARPAFQESCYWGTYFASRGLVLDGFAEQARNNCENLLYEVETYGFVPAGNRTFHLNRSQPPFLAPMIELIARKFPNNREWLPRAVAGLEKEMAFWNDHRRTPCGLHHYSGNPDAAAIEEFYADCCVRRFGCPAEEADPAARRAAALHALAEAESGWDFTPRFEHRCLDYAPIDLNVLMYIARREISLLYRDLGDLGHAMEWEQRAEIRRNLINRYCWNEERGVFLDYDFVNKRHSPVFSVASLFPLWASLATPEQAESTLFAAEKYLECDYGLAACEPGKSDRQCRWDYPNGWAPLQLIAIEAFDRNGFTEAARRLAQKYVDLVTANFEKTGELWEKYNVADGTVDIRGAHPMPAMMGWTAGVFVCAADYLSRSR